MNTELHPTDRLTLYLAHAQNWLLGVVAALSLVMVYALVQLNDENVTLRAENHTIKTTGCAPSMRGRPLAGAKYDQINLTRPHYSALICYYSRGITS